MASSLDDLLALKGVAAVGEFGRDGSLKDFKANVEFSGELAETTAKFTAAVTQLFDVLAASFTQLNDQFSFAPQQGWAYSGGEWSVAVGGNRGVFVKTAEADYNELFAELVGARV